jgi:hypothetical protein
MSTAKHYHHPLEFPNEAFVDEVITDYLKQQGYTGWDVVPTQHDLVCYHAQHGKWYIEFKGLTKAPSTDFHTVVGQIIAAIKDDEPETTQYSIAIPAAKDYINYCKTRLSPSFRLRNHLSLFFVHSTKSVTFIAPEKPIEVEAEI